MDKINWEELTEFFNSAIASKKNLKVTVESEELGKKLSVVVPAEKRAEFIKALPVYEAKIEPL